MGDLRGLIEAVFRRRKVYRMGLGDVLIAYGTLNGKPCIALDYAPTRGPLGSAADEFKAMMERGATVISFETPQSLKAWVGFMAAADEAAAILRALEAEGKA